VLSLALHGALAGVVFLMPAQARRTPSRPIEVVTRKLPEPPKPEPPKPEPAKVEPEVRPAPTKVAMNRQLPKAEPKTDPEPEPKAEPKGPPPEDTGPKTFGLKMEGTTKAAPGTGVAIPRGDSIRVSPTITKKGPEKKREEKPTGFKQSYGRGEEAPVAVVTVQPKVLRQVTAEYPEQMKELGIEGRVVLELTIDGSGKVAGVKVLTGLRAELDAVAVAAARKLLFSPATVNGVPVKIKIPYTFTFVLD
jgi:TonB family protein